VLGEQDAANFGEWRGVWPILERPQDHLALVDHCLQDRRRLG